MIPVSFQLEESCPGSCPSFLCPWFPDSGMPSLKGLLFLQEQQGLLLTFTLLSHAAAFPQIPDAMLVVV